MLHVRGVTVDARLPRNHGVQARIYRRYRRRQRDLISGFDLSLDDIHVDAPAAKLVRHYGIFGTTDNRSTKGNDLMDQIWALTGGFPHRISSQTPAGNSDLLPSVVSQSTLPFELILN